MNNILGLKPTSPRHALLAPQEPMHREPPLWGSSLSSKPTWSGDPADLVRPRDGKTPPLFPTLATILGTWDPGRHPRYRVAPQQPMRREDAGPPASIHPPHSVDTDRHQHDHTAADGRAGAPLPPSAKQPDPPQDPIRREAAAPSGPGPLRNGNPRGNPNLAPRCGAKTRAGCPCRGPAMKNGRCRMHGGASTGPKTAEGRARIAAARAPQDPMLRELQAKATALTEANRVLAAVVETGLELEAVTPLLHRIKPATRDPPYAVSPLLLLTASLTRREGRDLAHLIRATAEGRGKTRGIASGLDASRPLRPSWTGLPRPSHASGAPPKNRTISTAPDRQRWSGQARP